MRELFKKLRCHSGQALIEYVLLLAFISVGCFAVLVSLGDSSRQSFEKIIAVVDGSPTVITPPAPVIPGDYVLATDADFVWNFTSSGYTVASQGAPGYYVYVGSDDKVIVPDTIKGDTVTNYYKMFRGTFVSAVANTNSNISSMAYFFGTSFAPTLDVSYLKTENVTNMEHFFDSSQATTITFGSFDTGNVLNMDSMFYGSPVVTLDLSSFDTSNTNDMSSLFADTTALTTVDVGGFNTSKVTRMFNMFANTYVMNSIDISGFDTSHVTNMSGMFSWSAATNIDMGGIDTAQVTNMSGMFDGCAVNVLDLTEFNTNNVTDMSGMFTGAFSNTIDLSSFNTASLINSDEMFASVNATTIYVRNSAECDVFDNSFGRQDGLVFTVK